MGAFDDIIAMAMQIPPEEQEKLPPDFSEQLDHYIYGTPKKGTAFSKFSAQQQGASILPLAPWHPPI